MNATYTRTFPVTATEVDVFGNCRPGALLTMFQDMATDHAEHMGIHRAYLVEHYNAIWMLARLWYRLERPIKMGEELTIVTWHRGPGGMTVYRDFDLYVGTEYVGECVSSWVVTDVDSRRMLRTGNVENIAKSPVPEKVKDKTLRGLHRPGEISAIYSRGIRFSDLDVNGHMNNTKYADILMDAFAPEELKGQFISSLQLTFSRECLYGETVEVFRGETENGHYVEGVGGGEKRFDALVQFSKE